jgi:hypothetical protein
MHSIMYNKQTLKDCHFRALHQILSLVALRGLSHFLSLALAFSVIINNNQTYRFFYPDNPVYPRSLDPSVLVFSLSLYRHPTICILFGSRFTSYKPKKSSRSYNNSQVGQILGKTGGLRIMLNIDGEPIPSRSHTHPSQTQNSHLLTSSLSSGVPVPHTTQCL